MNKARIITTLQCTRHCKLCSNKMLRVETKAVWCKLTDIGNYDEYILTGGEPLIDIGRIIDIAWHLKNEHPRSEIYLYTTLFSMHSMDELMKYIDGITYSVHVPFLSSDRYHFMNMQNFANRHPNKSFRLWIDQHVNGYLEIRPADWDRITVAPMLKDCKLPEDEQLFILED